MEKLAVRLTEVNKLASGLCLQAGERDMCSKSHFLWRVYPLENLAAVTQEKVNSLKEDSQASMGPGQLYTSNWKIPSLKKNFKGLKLWLWDSLEETEWGDHQFPFFFLSLLIKTTFVAAIKENNSVSMFCKLPIKRRGERKKDVAIKISVSWSIHTRQL